MQDSKSRGWQVTFAGLGINLALGILYTWSIFKLTIKESIESGDGVFTWSIASLNDPYALCCLFFAAAMIPAGRMQDKTGPKITAIIGGVLIGVGLLVCASSTSWAVWILGFGILTGAGIGFGYASATPPAIKWFPPAKTGMIAGIVVSGFGLASVYIAPLSSFLIDSFGLTASMMIFGVAFLVLVCILAQFLVNPPAGYVPAQVTDSETKTERPQPARAPEIAPGAMIRTGAFCRLWIMFFIGAGAGLMIISGVAGMAKAGMGSLAWVVVALVAVGNAGGRIIAGMVSDKIGRQSTLFIMLLFQALVIFSLPYLSGEQGEQLILLVAAATCIGFNYGSNLSLFPAVTKDYFGLKNFGTNYGLLFSAWGVGGLVFPRVSQMIVAQTGSPDIAYILMGVLLVIAAVLALISKPPVPEDSRDR